MTFYFSQQFNLLNNFVQWIVLSYFHFIIQFSCLFKIAHGLRTLLNMLPYMQVTTSAIVSCCIRGFLTWHYIRWNFIEAFLCLREAFLCLPEIIRTWPVFFWWELICYQFWSQVKWSFHCKEIKNDRFFIIFHGLCMLKESVIFFLNWHIQFGRKWFMLVIKCMPFHS